MSVVVNLFGGPGTGKSTTAAQVFAHLKQQGKSVELVREYVKDWAWEQRKIGPLHQPYIFGEQSHREGLLYGKVDSVITDSPLLLSGFYHSHYFGVDYLTPTILGFMKHAFDTSGTTYLNIVLGRVKPYVGAGRYETEEQAKNLDTAITTWLDSVGQSYHHVLCDQSAAERITKMLLLQLETR